MAVKSWEGEDPAAMDDIGPALSQSQLFGNERFYPKSVSRAAPNNPSTISQDRLDPAGIALS